MPNEQKDHIRINNIAIQRDFQTPRAGRASGNFPNRTRSAHAQKLLTELNMISAIERPSTATGRYIEFSGSPDYDLTLKSLELASQGIFLLNSRTETGLDGKNIIKATVFIPFGSEDVFRKKITEYQTQNTKDRNGQDSGKAKHLALVESIEEIKSALLEDFWTDKNDISAIDSEKWCEIWVNTEGPDNIEDIKTSFYSILEECGIEYKTGCLIFPGRLVMLVLSDKTKFGLMLQRTGVLAEIKLAQQIVESIANESKADQDEWIGDLISRTTVASDVFSHVFILDTGVNESHPLLANLVSTTGTVEAPWGSHDHHGHGTAMSGIIGYGDLLNSFLSTENISIKHKIGSVKLLPPSGSSPTPEELWGAFTQRAIAVAETLLPPTAMHTNSYCMPVTAKGVFTGKPSSWSSAVDQIVYNEGDRGRIMFISSGNTIPDPPHSSYPDICELNVIQDPAQSWNAVTVGAITDKVDSTVGGLGGICLAEKGELSPHTTSSINWDSGWPMKPEIVFEGGNLLSHDWECDDSLCVLTTSHQFNTRKPLTTTFGTSAATAYAGWFVGKLVAKYPGLSPETIRGLMIHSAEWSESLLRQFGIDLATRKPSKDDVEKLIRHAGYGVPNLNKAMYSEENSLTMIMEEEMQPFITKRTESGSSINLNEMHFFELPWPKVDLEALGSTKVKLKITVSYFIDPAPGEKGWKDKYKYQSHGINFDINDIDETKEQFMKRINKKEREEDEEILTESGSDRWLIGAKNRNHGSIHSDIWEGTGSDLAKCGIIGVYPVGGWWKFRKKEGKMHNKTKYSLIVSLETESLDVHLYTTIQTLIAAQIPVEIVTNT